MIEVITVESSAFKTLTEQIAEITRYIRESEKAKSGIASNRLVGTREACSILNVSGRTLQRMRAEYRIRYTVFRGKCQYRTSELNRLLQESTVTDDTGTLEETRHNYDLRTGGNRK